MIKCEYNWSLIHLNQLQLLNKKYFFISRFYITKLIELNWLKLKVEWINLNTDKYMNKLSHMHNKKELGDIQFFGLDTFYLKRHKTFSDMFILMKMKYWSMTLDTLRPI